jgi:hypothetical protein
MKNIYFNISKVVFLAFFLMNYISVAQVGIGTTTPDASSMLEIQSDAKGVLIPRMLTTDRMAILNPADGLLVFDTDTKSFWFYSGSWTEVRGSAERWDDLRVPVNTVKTGSSWWAGDTASADWGSFLGGTQLIWFYSNTDANAVYFSVQMPHSWKEGSAIFPHVHWTNKSAPGQNRVTWVLEYTWTNPGEAFSGTTPITGYLVPTAGDDGSIQDDIVLNEHAITPLGAATGIDATNKTISSTLICKLSRKASDSNDTYSGSAGLIEIDFHYQIDSDGSSAPYTK